MYDRAADYRRAVDEHLFGLGAQRYEALVNLLIQLRQPQLSKKPDEKLLSRALTEALPPLSPGLVTTVADAFRGLDEERDALRSLAEAQEASTAFLGHYRRYAKVAAKRKAAGPRLTQSRYEQLGRDLAAAEEAFTAAQRQLDEAQRELDGTGGTAHRAGSAPESAGGRPGDARRRAAQAAPRGRGTQGESDPGPGDRPETGRPARSRGTPRRRPRPRTGPAPDGTSSPRRCDEAASTAADAACAQQHQAAVAALDGPGLESASLERAGSGAPPPAERADGEHRAVAAYLDAPEAPAADILARARRDAQAIADRQAQAVAQLARLLEESATRERQLRAAQEAEGRLSAEVQAAADRVTAADLAVEERMRLLLDAYRLYLGGLAELRVADPDELIAALESWGLTGEGANPAAAIIDDAARVAGAELGQHGRGARQLSEPSGPRGRASWRRRSADCARAATTPRRFRTRGPPASATAVPARRCGR